jgi:alpha-beta hydrolase superfamily lysophospholipase
MFTGVTWYGNESRWDDPTDALDYYDNVRNAFLTASNLSVAVANLPGTQKFIMAHSLGNIVVSSAIQDFGMNIDAYFAIDAAVATEAYDGGRSI